MRFADFLGGFTFGLIAYHFLIMVGFWRSSGVNPFKNLKDLPKNQRDIILHTISEMLFYEIFDGNTYPPRKIINNKNDKK